MRNIQNLIINSTPNDEYPELNLSLIKVLNNISESFSAINQQEKMKIASLKISDDKYLCFYHSNVAKCHPVLVVYDKKTKETSSEITTNDLSFLRKRYLKSYVQQYGKEEMSDEKVANILMVRDTVDTLNRQSQTPILANLDKIAALYDIDLKELKEQSINRQTMEFDEAR